MRLMKTLCVLGGLAATGCATTPSPHGNLSSLSVASSQDAAFCEHRVPQENCTRCHPELAPRFQAAKDWCGEHGVPESQCFTCHPDLSFEPLPELAPGADLVKLSHEGEDVPELASHAVPGKVTVFDFYADWCPPCRKVDAHMFPLLNTRQDIAYRKLNVVSWDSPLAKRHLGQVENLPYLVVYGKDGKLVRAVKGFDPAALEAALAEAGAR
ncbi:thioredoxin family protein [Archangium violaceum]|uniref:thioredoxin family protein n=1 Tax=Archangium violaceum TaxID=83451 RepID=UPI000696F63C|nr:thioredoxin family protein [Archangium violaceum]